ncbi:MAG: hypothetical protein JXP34_28510 [Planctomycetes bacterium]|nr:hypothetical protein [Planctomycetota bacterium]
MSDANRKQRKPYIKPAAQRVPLRPEEAVLGNCKIASTSGPATANCGTVVCYSTGS